MGQKKEPKTWEETESLDEILSPEEKDIISGLSKKESCPHLQRTGKSFYYCGKDLSEDEIKKIENGKPLPTNPA